MIRPEILQEMLDSAPNAASKGQAQFETPMDWAAAFAIPLPGHRPVITDLTCGHGALLCGAANRDTARAYGVDIDPCHLLHKNHWPFGTERAKIAGDLTLLYPLLCDAKWFTYLFVLNPPWDLHWERSRLSGLAGSECIAVAEAFSRHDGRLAADQIDSTVATLCIALDRSNAFGEGYIIGNESTLRRLILQPGAPHSALAKHLWAHLTISGNVMTGSMQDAWGNPIQTGVLYFARGHTAGLRAESAVAFSDLKPGAVPGVKETNAESILEDWRARRSELLDCGEAYWHLRHDDIERGFLAAREEWLQRQKSARTDYHLCLNHDGTIHTYLSVFDELTERIDVAAAGALHKLEGQHPMSTVLQRQTRNLVLSLTEPDRPGAHPWRVEPALAEAIRRCVSEYHSARAPLYPLNPIQRLGYLDEEDAITCCASDREHGFRAGQTYPLRTVTVQVSRRSERPNLAGIPEQIETTGNELAILITNDQNKDVCYMDSRVMMPGVSLSEQKIRPDAPLQKLIDHFQIPDVPDVSTVHPDAYRCNLKRLDEVMEATNLNQTQP